MPQSTKDSAGGKSHPAKSSGTKGKAATSPKSGTEKSPVGPAHHGEKKTTP